MKFLSLFTLGKHDADKRPEIRSFSDFFLHATDAEKEAVLTKAAHRANEEQLRVFTEAKGAVGAR